MDYYDLEEWVPTWYHHHHIWTDAGKPPDTNNHVEAASTEQSWRPSSSEKDSVVHLLRTKIKIKRSHRSWTSSINTGLGEQDTSITIKHGCCLAPHQTSNQIHPGSALKVMSLHQATKGAGLPAATEMFTQADKLCTLLLINTKNDTHKYSHDRSHF